MAHACRICGCSEGNAPFVAREMMFGFRDRFEYFQCARCRCLQISQIPGDLRKYYPSDYYAFAPSMPPVRQARLTRALRRERLKAHLGQRSVLGALWVRLAGAPYFPPWAVEARFRLDHAILDVGCGAGGLLRFLRHAGFADLTGIDPYLAAAPAAPDGIRLIRAELPDEENRYDRIMLHHSLEHMPDPFRAFDALRRALRPDGVLLLRTPVADSYAWRHYGADWMQFDAPRHLFVHSVESIRILAERSGFRVSKTLFDSTLVQFLGSEQYRRDIPLNDPRSFTAGEKGSIFSKEDLERYKAEARRLNATGEGDQACFYLEPVRTGPNR